MPNQPQPSLSETELEVLRVLWRHGPLTAREAGDLLAGRKRRWAYTTVLTLLHRLKAKGYATTDTSNVAHVFRPVVSREKLLRQRLRRLAVDLCDGAASPLISALVADQKFSADEIREFRELLDRLDQPNKSPVKRRTKDA